ncbi:MAG: acyl-CoA dehydrogenase family protein [Alphaproteobacteria bacterium]|jgi:alkylation response protein AidB-like acyl-CoA dehydrogenase
MTFTAKDEAFRQEVRTFIYENLPQDIAQKHLAGMEIQKDDYMRWHKILAQKGWVAPNWPEEHGGCGWDTVQRYIFDEEAGLAGAPRLSGFGLNMCGPVLMAFGTPEQKAEHLPKIHSGERVFCQGYSEPGSGSDLASLKSKAEKDGDDYVINGQKIWTSLAHHADWIFMLVRTSQEPKKQDGISFLIFPMTTPGIEIRPIITMNGLHHTNETFFTDVRVPQSSLVGQEGRGWTIAKYLLGHERMGGGSCAEVKVALRRVQEIAEAETDGGGDRLIDDPSFRRKLMDAETQLWSVEQLVLKTLSAYRSNAEIGAAANMIKVRRSEVQQLVTEIGTEAAAYYSQPFNLEALRFGWNEEPVGAEYFNGLVPNYTFLRAASIYSGSNEIQRNIVSKGTLGL